MKQGFIWAQIFNDLYNLIYQKFFLMYFQSLGDKQKDLLLECLGGSALILLILIIGLHIYFIRLKKHFLKTTIRELRREHRLLKVALASIGEGIITTDKAGKVIFISSAAQEMTGYPEKEAMGRSIGEIFHVVKEDTGEPLEIPISTVIREGRTFQLEENAALISRNGNRYLIADSVAPIRNNKDKVIGAVVTFQDVTKARKAEEVKSAVYKIASVSNNSNSLKECFTEIHRVLASIIDASNFYIALYDSEKEIINFAYYVDEYEKVYNLEAHTTRMKGKGVTEYIINHGRTMLLNRSDFLRLEESGEVEIIGALPEIWMGTPLKIEDKIIGVMAVQSYSDPNTYTEQDKELFEYVSNQIAVVIERKQKEETIRHLAYYDVLTDLPNRALYCRSLDKALMKAKKGKSLGAVLLLDLDGFKNVNDTLGHVMGDYLLKEVAWRLKGCLREKDIIARWGGDEFTVLLPDLKGREEGLYLANKLIEALNVPFELHDYQIHISVSAGVCFYPHDGKDTQTLIKNADSALYCAKERGKNQYQLFSQDMNASISKSFTLENYLRHALEKNEFVLHYQPTVNTETGQITGMEALIRWHHPELGLIPPSEFIPLAEETGLIIPIGEWVLYTACKYNAELQRKGFPPLSVAVNISSKQFQHPDFIQRVKEILAETGLAPQYLVLELTESGVMHNLDHTISLFKELGRMGVKIALDDFGTGYSSLSYLGYLTIHSLKIDQSFVRDIQNNESHAMITQAVIALARSLKFSITAEGVETREQKEILSRYQCDEMQGYYFSPPLPAEKFEALLEASAGLEREPVL